jgi:hypothetical protein
MHHMLSFWKQVITESLIVKITKNLQKYTTLWNKGCFINVQDGTVYKCSIQSMIFIIFHGALLKLNCMFTSITLL